MSSSVNLSPNMNLPVPVVGVDTGPDWATQLNNCLGLLDIHDHSAGRGVQITPSGINISSALSFNNQQATSLQATAFSAQGSTLSTLAALYVVTDDLYYNDGLGNIIRITQAGSLSGVNGTIANLASPASATYVSADQTFVWQSNANTPANMDNASVILRNLIANSKGLTLAPPLAMPADYQITLPSLPNTTKFMTLDASGNMAANITIDNSTIINTANVLSVNAAALPNTDREHAWELNGAYPGLTYPLTNIDSIFIPPYNITITSVWIYNGDPGTSGTTEYDLQVANPASSFTSILSTTGKITSAAANFIWTDSGSVIGVQTGVTKPVIGTAAILAGQAIRFDIPQSMTGTATDARIRIFYKQS